MSMQAKRMSQIVRRGSLSVTVVALLLPSAAGAAGAGHGDGQVEPQAGTWHTWLLASGSQLRPPRTAVDSPDADRDRGTEAAREAT